MRLLNETPNTSFPDKPPSDLLAEYGVYPVVYQDKPGHDLINEVAVRETKPTLINGEWVLGYNVREKTSDEKAQMVNRERDRLHRRQVLVK